MSFLLTTFNGFCFGIGLILAAFIMKFIFHIGFC